MKSLAALSFTFAHFILDPRIPCKSLFQINLILIIVSYHFLVFVMLEFLPQLLSFVAVLHEASGVSLLAFQRSVVASLALLRLKPTQFWSRLAVSLVINHFLSSGQLYLGFEIEVVRLQYGGQLHDDFDQCIEISLKFEEYTERAKWNLAAR